MKALCFSLILTALCLTLAAGRAEAWGPDGQEIYYLQLGSEGPSQLLRIPPHGGEPTLVLTDCIDLLPTLAVLAALAEGTSELSGIGRANSNEQVADGPASQETELAEARSSETEAGRASKRAAAP